MCLFFKCVSCFCFVFSCRDSRSFIRCIDSDPDVIAAIKAAAEADPVCAKNMANG